MAGQKTEPLFFPRFFSAGKKPESRLLFLVFFVLFFSTLSFAQAAVSIQSIKAMPANEIYANEVREFKIVAINLSNERIVGEKFKVLASSELSLLEKELETSEQFFLVPELLPNQAIELRFWVKARSEPSEKAVVSVNFGQTVFSDLTATRLRIVPSPLRVVVHPQKSVVATGEVSALLVSLFNDSNFSLQGIRSELVSSERADSLSKPFEAAEFLPKQSVEDRLFEFWPRPLASGTHQLTVKTVFSDALGEHQLNHRVEVQVRETTSFVLFLVGALLVVGILYWLWIRTVSKPPVKLHPGLKEEKK